MANVIASADLANNIVQTGLMAAELANSQRQTDIMTQELAESRKGNRLAERANWIAEKANDLAVESNQIAEQGNQLSQKANDISREANKIARDANSIARMDLTIANKANYLSQKQMNQDYKIAMMTLDQERKLSDASSELDIMLNEKLTNSISSGLEDVAAAIKDGLDKLADITQNIDYMFEINQTKMVASILHTMYTDYMLNNRDARLSPTEVMKIMQEKFENHLDDMEKFINDGQFQLRKFLHIAHLNSEEMQKKDCDWNEVRSRGFAINTMFMVLNQTIKKRNITKYIPQIFEDEGKRFFKSFVNFNIRSSYEFDTRCFRNKVCFDSHFTKMPSELHCYEDKEKIEKYCGAYNQYEKFPSFFSSDFSISCEEDQATIKREKIKEGDRYFAICLKSFASRHCQRFKTEASDFVANLPTCAFKIQPGL